MHDNDLERLPPTRRSFLKTVGFSFTAATVAGCSRGKDVRAVPWLDAPEHIVPGRGYEVATTCAGCDAGCGVLAKCIDGRPIKLEGNPESHVSGGGLCAAGQASLLSLYDSHRLAKPFARRRAGKDLQTPQGDLEWSAAIDLVRARLHATRTGKLRVLTGTGLGPSTRALVERLVAGSADGRWDRYDPFTPSAWAEAHLQTHGSAVVPRPLFDRARVIVSFDADFLGTWLAPVEFARGWAAARRPEAGVMSRHIQLEARMSLTGSCADERIRLAPWERGAALAVLCSHVAKHSNLAAPVEAEAVPEELDTRLDAIAAELCAAPGACLVVCGSGDVAEQRLVNWLNATLGSYGTTLDWSRPAAQRNGDESRLAALIGELASGTVDVLVVHGVNPAYDLQSSAEFAAATEKVGLVVQLTQHRNETSELCDLVLPEAHALEAWDDSEPWHGMHGLRQPTLPRLGDGRTLRAVLARWLGEQAGDRDLLRAYWRASIFTLQSVHTDFDAFFDAALEHGGFVAYTGARKAPALKAAAVTAPKPVEPPAAGELGVVSYTSPAMLDGRHAHNPWLHELADPVSKITWDNYVALSPQAAADRGLDEGDVVAVESGGAAVVELPVHIQPGQHDRVCAIAVGYGRLGTDRFADVGPEWLQGKPTVEVGSTVGRSASPLVGLADGRFTLDSGRAALRPAGRRVEFASTQDHHTLTVPKHLGEHRGEHDIVHSASFAAWREDPDHAFGHAAHAPAEIWSDDHQTDDHGAAGHRWALVVDLANCTGCSACVIGCQAENNVPVVGKDEVRRHREMGWLRIDRYWEGTGDDVQAIHQPMMCQHCGNAPCETVCPVLATVHSSEGLNQQVYNRCVGTRYCANNCPYKARRFNWFDYPHEDRLQNMSLNPNVTIRSRGVMEKCSMCVQRIQDAKGEANREGREIADGDIKTACEQSCPTQAITFGDMHDSKSRVVKELGSKRRYTVIPELNTKPRVQYLGLVRNPREGQH